MKDCTTCKYGYEDERLGIRMCHRPKRFSEDCVNFNKHEEKETEESEKPINPDDAMKELNEKIALVKERGTWEGVDVDSYMDEVRGRVSDDLEEAARDYTWDDYGIIYEGERVNGYIIDHVKDAFIAGAKWDRSQMLKEAVEGTVMDFSSNQPRPQVDVLLDPHKYHTGDKVRVIIVKEDEK